MQWLRWPLLNNLRRMCGLFVAFYASVHLWVYVQFVSRLRLGNDIRRTG